MSLLPRADRLEAARSGRFDVAIVGGGITGAGLALDLQLRGLSCLLVERGDWGGATSSASSRLVHGGLRYLEQFELSLVRDSCLERALLLDNAAGLTWPETFLFPVRQGDRVGRPKLGAGLLLYTLLSIPRVLGIPRLCGAGEARRRLPGIDAKGLRGGGHYLDGATDDARLTLAICLSAAQAGTVVLSRTEARSIEVGETARTGAELHLEDRWEGGEWSARADAVILAGGPFTEDLRSRAGLGGAWIASTRGSHITVPREKLPTDGAVIFASAVDGRVMFLIPWPRYTVVGTTDLDADPKDEVRATRGEVRYLLDSANALVPAARLGEADVVSTWAGLRPLLASGEDPSARSREERVVQEGPLFTIAGGKLTGYRSMAEGLARRVTEHLGRGDRSRASATRGHRLRGALPMRVERPLWSSWTGSLPQDPLACAWAKRYAGLVGEVRGRCRELPRGEEALDPETLLGEVDWACAEEDCLGPEDFLLRRTDLGYGPEAGLEGALHAVLERLSSLGSWSPERRQGAREKAATALARLHAWRRDPE